MSAESPFVIIRFHFATGVLQRGIAYGSSRVDRHRVAFADRHQLAGEAST